MEFSHIGLITDEQKEGEIFVEATRVWITDFVKHPFHVEWLRFEPDTPLTGPVRNQPHVAYHVDSIEEASRSSQSSTTSPGRSSRRAAATPSSTGDGSIGV